MAQAKSPDEILAELNALSEEEWQAELHNEYASRIRAQLSGIPPEKRTEVMEGIRRELSRTWDADFINAVMRQLQQEK